MTARPGGDPRYEEVRRRLVERGYLQGPLERFVLRDLGGGPHGRLGTIRTALKAAVLGAPIVGAVPAAAAIAAHRPLLRGSDGLVLWLYFAALAAIVLFVVDLALGSWATAVARRGGSSPRTAGLAGAAVGVPFLAYLALLWARRGGSPGLAADLLFLGAASIAALAVAWLARLVSLAGIVRGSGEVPARSRRGIATWAVVLLPAGVALLAFARAGNSDVEVSAAPFEPADAPRLVVIGVDGLDAALVTALADSGSLDPWMARLESGTVVPLRRAAGLAPPEVWTTIATGVGPEIHGIRTAAAARLPGVSTPLSASGGPIAVGAALRFLLPVRAVPASGATRTSHTVWEIVGLRRPVAAIGWWASWPARRPTAGGYVVTDRALTKLLADLPGDRDVDPEALYSRWAEEFPETRRSIDAEVERYIATTELPQEVQSPFREACRLDAWNLAVAAQLSADPELEGTFVYLPGLDILRDRLVNLEVDSTASPFRSTPEMAVKAYVGWLAARTAALWSLHPESVGVLIADPGRLATGDSEGFMSVFGLGVPAECVEDPRPSAAAASVLLALAGFPESAEMVPRGDLRCLAPAAASPPRIPTYGRSAAGDAGSDPAVDREVLERLRSLGYVR